MNFAYYHDPVILLYYDFYKFLLQVFLFEFGLQTYIVLLNLASLVVADRLNAYLSNEMRLPNIIQLS